MLVYFFIYFIIYCYMIGKYKENFKYNIKLLHNFYIKYILQLFNNKLLQIKIK